jgi:hypothetical protein
MTPEGRAARRRRRGNLKCAPGRSVQVEGRHQVAVPGAGSPVLGQQLSKRHLDREPELAIGILVGPWRTDRAAEQRFLDPLRTRLAITRWFGKQPGGCGMRRSSLPKPGRPIRPGIRRARRARRADTAFPAPITRATGRYPHPGAVIS